MKSQFKFLSTEQLQEKTYLDVQNFSNKLPVRWGILISTQ